MTALTTTHNTEYLAKVNAAKAGTALEMAAMIAQKTAADAEAAGVQDQEGPRSFLKFNGMEGDFSTKELGEIPLGTKMVFNMAEYSAGYTCWKKNKMLHKSLAKVFGGNPIPTFAEAQVKFDFGPFDDQDGWKEIISVPGKFTEGGPNMVFEPNSKGAINAVLAMAKKWGENVKFHIDDEGLLMLPVVELGSRGYKSEKARRTLYSPEFKIVDWMTQADFLAIQDNVSQDYAAEDSAPKGKAGSKVDSYRKK